MDNSNDWKITDPPLSDNNFKAFMDAINCHLPNYSKGCVKQIRSRVSGDATYIAVAAMAVLLVEIIASFLAGWRAFTINEK